eukprot:gene7660-7863_t
MPGSGTSIKVLGFIQQQQHNVQQPDMPSLAAVAAATAVCGDGSLHEPLLAHNQQRDQPQQPYHLTSEHQARGTDGSGNEGGNANHVKLREAMLLCIPTAFDLAATTLMNVGLLYVAASVFQILRGSEMLFAALFAVLFLKRRLNKWHFMGVGLSMVGLSLVGVSRVLAGDSSSGENIMELGAAFLSAAANNVAGAYADSGASASADPKKALLGMALILASQALQAGQVTIEDHFMADMNMDPLKVVGWEGVIGSIVMLGVALPVLQVLPFDDGSGLAEDSKGSWCMMRSSPSITGAVVGSSVAVLVYNVAGMYVTEEMGAAARTVVENARTLLVWVAALVLYYTHAAGGNIGEAWDHWSWLQAVGFAVFAAGAFLYDQGHRQQDEQHASAGTVPHHSQWAVLKSTLGVHTGHYVGLRNFRIVGNAVLAGVRAGRLAQEHCNNAGQAPAGAVEHV